VIPVAAVDGPAAPLEESEAPIDAGGNFVSAFLVAVFALGLVVGLGFIACRRSVKRQSADADEAVPFNVDLGSRGYELGPRGGTADELAKLGFSKV
jgi:hypothetical protein